jgi:hypothetical protein
MFLSALLIFPVTEKLNKDTPQPDLCLKWHGVTRGKDTIRVLYTPADDATRVRRDSSISKWFWRNKVMMLKYH